MHTNQEQGQERRKILEMVAEGKISPSEAATLLEATATTQQVQREVKSNYSDISGVKVIGTFRALRIEGDESVQGAIAEGTHVARKENGTIVFEEDASDDEPGFVLFGSRAKEGQRGRRIKIDADFGSGKRFQIDREFPFHRPPVLKIRMNPELPLDIDITAGPVKVRDVRGTINAQIAAGSATFVGVRKEIHIACDAGAVSVSGVLDGGNSDVRCTAGKVRLVLEKGSNVKVTAKSTLGKISLPEGEWQGVGGGRREFVVGTGAGTLDLEATTGLVAVEVEE